jgi:hypothetical protein
MFRDRLAKKVQTFLAKLSTVYLCVFLVRQISLEARERWRIYVVQLFAPTGHT